MSSRFEKKIHKLARPPVLQRYFLIEDEFPENMAAANTAAISRGFTERDHPARL